VQCFRIDNNVLKSVTAFLLSTIVYLALSFCVLRVADYNEARTACNNRHDMYSGEVHFVGSNTEPPYFSQGGRWSHNRRKYVRLFIGGVNIWLLLNCSLPFCSLSSIEVIASFRGIGCLVLCHHGPGCGDCKCKPLPSPRLSLVGSEILLELFLLGITCWFSGCKSRYSAR
jgi:hypothetical protein